MPTRKSKPTQDGANATSLRKPGRPFKSVPSPTIAQPSPEARPEPAERRSHNTGAYNPPALPYRSFKIILSMFKEQGVAPARLEKSAWRIKLQNTNVREALDAFRFLGLIDAEASPTADFAELMNALDENSWSPVLRGVLQRSYHQLLDCNITTMMADGLLRTFRKIYPNQIEDTRKRCNFFIHAAREGELQTAPFLFVDARPPWIDARRKQKIKDAAAGQGDRSVSPEDPDRFVKNLLLKLPVYDATWPDDVKRLWFSAHKELVQKLRR